MRADMNRLVIAALALLIGACTVNTYKTGGDGRYSSGEPIYTGMEAREVRSRLGDPETVTGSYRRARWTYQMRVECRPDQDCLSYYREATLIFRRDTLRQMYNMPGYATANP